MLLSAGVVGLSGCGSLTAASTEAAQVRFFDGSMDAPGLDLYMNGSGVAYNLSFGTVTSYVPVSPGETHIYANRANTSQALVTARAALGGARQYTAVVSNALGSLQETIYPDATTAAPAGMVAVRVLHAASESGPLDVYLLPGGGAGGALTAAVPVARDLGYLGAAGYVDVPLSAKYAIAVVPAGAPLTAGATTMLSGTSVTGASGAVRTIVLSDLPLAKGKGLDGFVLDDFDTP